jgi:hypothetical protein
MIVLPLAASHIGGFSDDSDNSLWLTDLKAGNILYVTINANDNAFTTDDYNTLSAVATRTGLGVASDWHCTFACGCGLLQCSVLCPATWEFCRYQRIFCRIVVGNGAHFPVRARVRRDCGLRHKHDVSLHGVCQRE